jgi:hypothetical protein
MSAATLRSIGLSVLAASACGPSLQTVHEGSVRFEHCYSVDLEPQIPAAQRRSCWQSWVLSYTMGQPRDRIEYAERRLRALDAGDTSCRELAIGADPPPEQRQLYLVAPSPTSVHTTPPPVATAVHADPAELADGGPTPDADAKTSDAKEPPAAACAGSCQNTWETCNHGCLPPGAPECATCKSTYTKCMRSCFR